MTDPIGTAQLIEDVAQAICLEVCELPDRTSPDDWPEACLVTTDELHEIVTQHLADALLGRLTERVRELSDILDTERYKVAIGVQDIRKALDGRRWLSEGGRGSYAYDDERYQQEFGAAIDEIDAALEPLRKVAGDWSNCPTDPLRVAANRSAALSLQRRV